MKKILVTEPFLPPKEEYQQYLNEIWDINWLTNQGPLVNKFESQIKNFLDVDNFQFLSNGTIALQIALKALKIKGEVITTPFSYVATTSSLVWENCSPIFVDIDPHSLNIDPSKIEAAITADTTAILATHVYGNPCDIDRIQDIADQHNLKVIYDGAHCFGTKYRGESVFNFGDISTTSFHATKLFHTIEGGGVFTKDENINYRLSRMKNFGHADFEKYDGLGINGKNSEFHAAMGLTNLKYAERIIQKRKLDYSLYKKNLKLEPIKLLKIENYVTFNHSYFPIIVDSETCLLNIKKQLSSNNVHTRRYFYPLLNSLSYVNYYSCPIAESISNRVLCLPMSYALDSLDIEHICKIVNQHI